VVPTALLGRAELDGHTLLGTAEAVPPVSVHATCGDGENHVGAVQLPPLLAPAAGAFEQLALVRR
jgi:hypothetical protein